jgi:integrase/recombinase XerD
MPIPSAGFPTFLEAIRPPRPDAARNTQLAYGRDLKDFADWAARRAGLSPRRPGGGRGLSGVLRPQGLSKATRARRLSSIRQLYRFAFDEGWRSDNPACASPAPARRPPAEDPDRGRGDAPAEAARDHGRNPATGCATALMELLYATGLRVSELVSLPQAAVRGDPRMILVRGKGGKERMVPLSPPARAAVADWLADRDAEDAGPRARRAAAPAALFPGPGAEGHLTRQYFFVLIKAIALRPGFPPPGSRRMCCAMPLPRIFWPAAPICG